MPHSFTWIVCFIPSQALWNTSVMRFPTTSHLVQCSTDLPPHAFATAFWPVLPCRLLVWMNFFARLWPAEILVYLHFHKQPRRHSCGKILTHHISSYPLSGHTTPSPDCKNSNRCQASGLVRMSANIMSVRSKRHYSLSLNHFSHVVIIEIHVFDVCLPHFKISKKFPQPNSLFWSSKKRYVFSFCCWQRNSRLMYTSHAIGLIVWEYNSRCQVPILSISQLAPQYPMHSDSSLEYLKHISQVPLWYRNTCLATVSWVSVCQLLSLDSAPTPYDISGLSGNS